MLSNIGAFLIFFLFFIIIFNIFCNSIKEYKDLKLREKQEKCILNFLEELIQTYKVHKYSKEDMFSDKNIEDSFQEDINDIEVKNYTKNVPWFFRK